MYPARFDGWGGCESGWWSGGQGFDPHRVRQHSFLEIDHEIFSTLILSFPLIQERLIWRENVHKYWLTAQMTKPAQEKCE